jgi:hypothetical protein
MHASICADDGVTEEVGTAYGSSNILRARRPVLPYYSYAPTTIDIMTIFSDDKLRVVDNNSNKTKGGGGVPR